MYLVVLLELVPRGDVLRRVALLRLEDLDVLVLVGGLIDRDEVVGLVGLVLVVEGCRALEAEEGLETCRLLVLPPLDLLLLLDFFAAKTGSINSIRAKNSVTTAILTFFWYFSVAIILLLKYLIITPILDPPLAGTDWNPALLGLLYSYKALTLNSVTRILPKSNHY